MTDRNAGTSSRDRDQSGTFRKWYGKHGDDLNDRRRSRYQTDPEYRERAKKAAKDARVRRKQRGGVMETHVTRIIAGKEVTLYRVGAASEMISKSPDTIRLWRRKGLIPDTDGQSLYSIEQIKLLKTLAYTIDKYRYSKDYQKILAKCSEHLKANW